jgi:hypothetical protein
MDTHEIREPGAELTRLQEHRGPVEEVGTVSDRAPVGDSRLEAARLSATKGAGA